jgi:hypothetical protein
MNAADFLIPHLDFSSRMPTSESHSADRARAGAWEKSFRMAQGFVSGFPLSLLPIALKSSGLIAAKPSRLG